MTDARLPSWSLVVSAGVTTSFTFTSETEIDSLTVYVGGTLTDVDDTTGATAYAVTMAGDGLSGTVDIPAPAASAKLRLAVNGVVSTRGSIRPSTSGGRASGTTIALRDTDTTVALTILGVVAAAPSVNVRNHGAVGDGSTNDYAAFAAAIAALPADGGELLVPAGDYRLGTTLTLTKPVVITGAGPEATILRAATGHTGSLVHVDSQWCGVHNITLDGNETSANCLLIDHPRCWFSKLFVRNAATNGIYVQGAPGEPAHANSFSDILCYENATRNVYVSGSAYDNRFSGLWLAHSATGMRVEGSDCFFTNLHVWGASLVGVEIRGPNIRFVNVYIETNASDGFNIFNADRTVINGGSIWKNGSRGINCQGTTSRTQVKNLNIYDNGLDGVLLADSALCMIQGNNFQDTQTPKTQTYAVRSTGTADKNIVTGNVMQASDHLTGAKSLVGSNNVTADNIE